MVAMPNTAPNTPWYRPRSRGGTMIGDDRDRGDDQPAAADSLKRRGTEYELHHVWANPHSAEPDEENDDRDLQH